MHIPKRITSTILAIALLAPAGVGGTDEPYEQEFVLTAYYSPLPGQCCYVKGGLEADKILNGQGIAAANGTAVYPGMLAAPPSYAFGTRIDLPGLGILTVHDRGGAIQELENGAHRLDVWAGHGEEGLARALAFGVQRIRGTVYPSGYMAPAESFSLEDMPAPASRLSEYEVRGDYLMDLETKVGDKGLSVVKLQEHLKQIGYFRGRLNGDFDETLHQSLANFVRDFQLHQPTDQLTQKTAAHLLAAVRRSAEGEPQPLTNFVDDTSAPKTIAEAQRILRYLGYYRGRTTGEYDENLFHAILNFQQKHLLVGTEEDPGAGRIGPLTMRALQGAWNRILVENRARRYMAVDRVDRELAVRGMHIDRFLQEGMSGPQVALLQEILAEHGFFDLEEVNGNFGEMTKEAVAKYQLDRGIISSMRNQAAGYVGPSTLVSLRREQRTKYYRLVRGQGWGVL